ncbi:MAG: sigma-70 family RNA polymerase sigma factor [Planctomycetia bacterium]|nr:sigma-70 family RNA polymerase sigma factor [Planctomycetia bacterium]
MDTPASLLERLRQPPDEQAWARFVQLYTPLLYFWARRTGCQEADAADLVQEALVVLVRKLPAFSYDRQQSFRGWLRTVAQNCWRNLGRKAELPRAANAPDLAELMAPEADEGFWEAEYRQKLVGRALQLMQADFQLSQVPCAQPFAPGIGRTAGISRDFPCKVFAAGCVIFLQQAIRVPARRRLPDSA